nr:hypothetical protein [Aliivibrio wodanis]
MFPNSKHVLDNEFEIEEKLASISRVDDEINCINYEFVESTDKENYHVQLSDVVCGFIRLYFDFLEFSSINEVEKFSVGLNHLQKTNLQLFFSLIDNSINEAALLLHRVIVPIDEHKATVLNERLNITNI